MSQAKVDKYKDYKKNKKKILKKQKRKDMAEKALAYGVGVALLAVVMAWIGSAAISQYQSYLASRPDYSRDEYVLSDLSGILETETETDTETETETESGSETETETETSAEGDESESTDQTGEEASSSEE